MRWLITGLLLCLVFLQFRLWVGDGSLAEVVQLQREIDQQTAENVILKQRNQQLAEEVQELKTGLLTIEARARQEMGMIKDGETFYMVVDADKNDATK
jgi:cell division protein FtsB